MLGLAITCPSCNKEEEAAKTQIELEALKAAQSQKDFEKNLYSYHWKVSQKLYSEIFETLSDDYGVLHLVLFGKGNLISYTFDGKTYKGELKNDSRAIKSGEKIYLKNGAIIKSWKHDPRRENIFVKIKMSQDIPGARNEDPPLWTLPKEKAWPYFLNHRLNGRLLGDFGNSEGLQVEIPLICNGVYEEDDWITGVQIWGPKSRLENHNGEVLAFFNPDGSVSLVGLTAN